MNNMSDNEYWQLINQYYNDQYDNIEDTQEYVDYAWIPSEPTVKEKIKNTVSQKVIDITDIKKDEIKNIIYNNTNIKVGNFLIKIDEYHFGPDLKARMDILLHEVSYKTLSGYPCNIIIKVNPNKDTRFEGRSWNKYFSGSWASDAPEDAIIDIIKWLQILVKLPAFI